MEIKKRTVGNCIILDCDGKIVLGPGTAAIRNAIRDASTEAGKKIILNLAEVNYIDSSGIGELVSNMTHVKNAGGKLVLLNLTNRIQELLVITRLITAFEVFKDEESATADC